jgi:hypothetical protein
MSKRRWVHFAFVSALVLGACGGGDIAQPGLGESENGRAYVARNASDGGTSHVNGACNSCSVDADCANRCPAPPVSGYIWCCAQSSCFTWPNECPPLTVGSGSGGRSMDSGSDAPPDDGGLFHAPTDCQPSGPHGGHRWQDLYSCYFGPVGNVSCAAMAGCHGQSGDRGTLASGFMCNPTSDACWRSMTMSIVATEAGADATMTLLYGVLCKSDGSGVMPPGCPNRLLTGDLARIAAWIRDGAPNN